MFWHDDAAYAIEDRCPHLGFPLHQGTVEAGLVTCHWHHARFDLVSGCTLDLWADDARGFDVDVRGDDVFVRAARRRRSGRAPPARGCANGLEDDITLVDRQVGARPARRGRRARREIVRTGVEFGTRYRDAGWGAGLTVLVAMANLLPHLDADDRALALVHGLAFVARDTRNHAPRFPVGPLDRRRRAGRPARGAGTAASSTPARPTRPSARSRPRSPSPTGSPTVEAMMFAAVTDHVFIDGGHTIDFTNKAFEALDHLGTDAAARGAADARAPDRRGAQRSEEFREWRHPHDLAALAAETIAALADAAPGGTLARRRIDVGALGWQLLADDPDVVADALLDALRAGADDEQLGRAIAYAAALRITRFHVQNDHGDWDTVHHSFTAANALHQALQRQPDARAAARRACTPRCASTSTASSTCPRPACRTRRAGSLDALAQCFDVQGMVDEAGNEAYGFLQAGGSRAELVAALGHALLAEDAEFHWYQTVEAGVRQAQQWPEGSEESALILVGVARFLAAHTPTRRELPTVVRIATRLRRGEALYEDATPTVSTVSRVTCGRAARRRDATWFGIGSSAAADVDVVGLVDEVGAALAVPGERDEHRRELGAQRVDPRRGRRRAAPSSRSSPRAGSPRISLCSRRSRDAGVDSRGASLDQLVEERAGRFGLDDVARPHLVHARRARRARRAPTRRRGAARARRARARARSSPTCSPARRMPHVVRSRRASVVVATGRRRRRNGGTGPCRPPRRASGPSTGTGPIRRV